MQVLRASLTQVSVQRATLWHGCLLNQWGLGSGMLAKSAQRSYLQIHVFRIEREFLRCWFFRQKVERYQRLAS